MSTSTGTSAAMENANPLPFPGRVVKVGETDRATVLAVQRRLNELGCGPIDEDGEFGTNAKNAVKLFQARFTDTDGLPLKVDGMVGAITWAALFGVASVPAVRETTAPLLAGVLTAAAAEIGVMEQPIGSNRGPRVDQYLQAVGLDPAQGSFPWCVAFAYFCFDQAAKALGRPNPMIKTAGVLDLWNKAGKQGVPRVLQEKAVDNPALIQPGFIFVLSTSSSTGHAGLVEQVAGGKLVTIEGNTNQGGSREGIGVFRRNSRKIVNINKGFIDYSKA